MTFSLLLPADHRDQPAPAGIIGFDPAYPDYEAVIRLFNSGPTNRAESLRMADAIRNARKERK